MNYPVAVAARKTLPPLKSPYMGRNRAPLQRHMSVPVREKNLPETLHEEDTPDEKANQFKY